MNTETNITAYHGTKSVFRKFQCPAYFTDDIETAVFFAEHADGDSISRILKCDMEFRNPLVINLHSQSWGGFFLDDELLQKGCINYLAEGDTEEIKYFNENGLTIPFLAEYAEYLGCDGVVAHNCLEENDTVSTQIVILDPNCVKSIHVEKMEVTL